VSMPLQNHQSHFIPPAQSQRSFNYLEGSQTPLSSFNLGQNSRLRFQPNQQSNIQATPLPVRQPLQTITNTRLNAIEPPQHPNPTSNLTTTKRGRGRPVGSKNKPKNQ